MKRNSAENMIDRVMDFLRKNLFWRNVLLAVCAVIIFLFFVNILLKQYTRHGQKYEVPNFTGMSVPEAQKAAKRLSLKLEVVDSLYMNNQRKGAVLEQYPKAGNNVKSGRRIFLTVNAFTPKMAEIPYVTGLSLRQAKNRLVANGFGIERLIYTSDIATNNIIDQRYDGKVIGSNTRMRGEVGSGVVLVVGMNAADPEPLVPKVVGLTIEQAKNKLWESGFNAGEIAFEKDITYENMDQARIYEQSPNQTVRSYYGREVSLKATVNEGKITTGITASEKEAAEYRKNPPVDSTATEYPFPDDEEE